MRKTFDDWISPPAEQDDKDWWDLFMDGARDRPHPKEMNPIVRDAVREKLEKFRTKGYVRQGTVKGLTSYFIVPKGNAMSGSSLTGPNLASTVPSGPPPLAFHLPTLY
jgi:hypothetical protein